MKTENREELQAWNSGCKPKSRNNKSKSRKMVYMELKSKKLSRQQRDSLGREGKCL